MLISTTIKVGIRSLWANKMRSFLAMLGIIIGVAAVIAMLAMGAGAKKTVMARIDAMGTNLLAVRPGQTGMRGVASGTSQKLTLEDAEAILADTKGVQRLAPAVTGSVQAKYMNHNSRTSVVGSSVTYLPIRDFTVEKGKAFTETQVEQTARVAILGPVTVDNLFGLNDPLGETVKLNGINFTVIGVLKAKGFDFDDQIIVPYTTAMKQLFGLDYLREIDIQAEEGQNLTEVQDAMTVVLRKRHKLLGNAPDDFNVRNQADMIQAAQDVIRTFTILLGGIASISLLVGGIGIMNIMLVSVTERTREIGIRKAIGAKERTILLQFLMEAVITTGLGGLLGVVAGAGAAKVIAKMSPNFATEIEPFSIILSLSFSAFVGIFFGFYPAWRAARLDPVEALRYE
ncbi:MAG: ABC transporter permease [Phycisphaerae bacterium]|jgi:putative ABC transport system permease protein